VTTEIVNPVIGRVDAVDGPATGMPFLLLKSQTPVVKDDGVEEQVEDIEGTDVQDGANIDGETVDDAAAVDANPGAPAWEAVDAAKARTATDALVQVRDQLRELASREGAEDDEASWDNQWNLDDAACALDFALATLAKFAVDEQNEADTGQRDAEADARALGLIKALSRHTTTEDTTVTDQTPATEVAKADDGTQVAVYDQNGNLLGSVDSDDLTPLATGPAADSDAATEGDAPAADAADATPDVPADPAAAPVAAAADPAPVAPAPAPVAPAPAADDETVTKSLDDRVAEAVAKALEAAVTTAVEPLVKSNAELTERLQKMEQTPRDSGPMLSGHRPNQPGPALRGHTADSDEVRKSLESETDPGKRVLGIAAEVRKIWGQ
jgi:hypothetical protein